MHNYRKLDVWRLSKTFVVDVYRVTDHFPTDEHFGLTQQLRRAAISITSNIAEGAGRGTGPDFARFLRIAVGSACEVETQIEVARGLGYLPFRDYLSLRRSIDSLIAKLGGLERAVRRSR